MNILSIGETDNETNKMRVKTVKNKKFGQKRKQILRF